MANKILKIVLIIVLFIVFFELGLFSWIGKLWNKVKGVVDWLKKKGVWKEIVNIAKTVGKWAGQKLCEKYAKSSKCSDIVNKFLDK